jgi:hypothetical protein
LVEPAPDTPTNSNPRALAAVHGGVEVLHEVGGTAGVDHDDGPRRAVAVPATLAGGNVPGQLVRDQAGARPAPRVQQPDGLALESAVADPVQDAVAGGVAAGPGMQAVLHRVRAALGHRGVPGLRLAAEVGEQLDHPVDLGLHIESASVVVVPDGDREHLQRPAVVTVGRAFAGHHAQVITCRSRHLSQHHPSPSLP